MEEEKRVFTAGSDAAVEVTVKIKKRRPSANKQDQHHRRHEKPVKEALEVFPKGSWGDLLSQHRQTEIKRSKDKHSQDKARHKSKKSELKCPEGAKISSGSCHAFPVSDGWRMETHSHPKAAFIEKGYRRTELKCPDGKKGPGGTCHMIPISEDLYMETHTHLKTDKFGCGFTEKQSVKKDIGRNRSPEEIHKEMENEKLKLEIELLKREVEKVRLMQTESAQLRKKIKYAAPVSTGFIRSGKYGSKPRPVEKEAPVIIASLSEEKKNVEQVKMSQARSDSPVILKESKGTSTSNINAGAFRKSEITQTDSKTPERLMRQQEQRNVRLEQLELENLALKREAQRVLMDLQKAQKDHADSIETMRELYKTAECLKQENQLLLAKQEEQQVIHERLMDAVNENQELKKFLQSAVTSIETSAEKENELAHIRHVIEEVKTTIENEMQEINHNQSSMSFYEKPEMIRGFHFNVSERESTALNDTNSSEIQRILKSLDQEVSEQATGENKERSSISLDQHNFSLDKSIHANDSDELSKSVSKAFRPIQDELLNLSSSTGGSESMQ